MDNSSLKLGTPSRKPTPAEARRTAKNERKHAAQEAARKAAAARKRRNAGLLSAGGIVLVVAIVVLVVTLGTSAGKKANAAGSPSASTSASAAPLPVAGPTTPPSPTPTPVYKPNVPKGESSKLKTKPVVTAGTGTVSKLKVTTLIQGTGVAVKKGDTIRVSYVGVTYKDAQEFDSSWKDGQDFSTEIGAGKVIPGWDQGLIGVKAGSRVQLDIPAALAYGTDGTSGPAGDLRFVIDVLEVTPAA